MLFHPPANRGGMNQVSRFPLVRVLRLLRHPVSAVMAFVLLAGSAPATVSTRQAVPELSAAAVAAFADGQLPVAMREGKIPGAVLVVVRGDRMVFQKSYGFANLENREPVSTSNTLFRVASISKILTAAAVLQLAQAHLLSLHRNVNRYLTGFRIAPAFGAPITLFDLLTHSSGFDVCPLAYAARTAAQKLSLRDYLAEFQPVRVRPPGVFSGYDNYGYALAGYLVQKASGIPFPQYVQERLLQPLDMDHSSFSPDPALRRNLATGYWLEDGTLRPYRQAHVNITPAAGLCSTAADMSQFLIALLANQRPDGSRAFPASVMRGLETQQFAFNPEVPGRCYGFDEIDLDGRQVLRQSGQWPGFNSLLLLFPRRHYGLFIAYNRCDQLHLGRQISRLFAEQFLPPIRVVGSAEPLPLPTRDELRPLCGYYLSVRFSQDSPDLGVPPGLAVIQGPAGQLEIGGRPFREIQPLVFEQIVRGGIPGHRVAFRLGPDGHVADLITDGSAFRRVSWSETRQGCRWLMRAATFVFLSVVVVWPIVLVIRFIGAHTVPKPAMSGTNRQRVRLSWAARGTAFAACALALWFEAVLALTELRLHPFADLYGLPASIRSLMGVMPLLMVLTVSLVVFSIVIWRIRLWSLAQRLHYSLIPAALALFVYVFYCQHLLFVTFSGSGLI
jgi:CubicO group peptidase (beta-lactamase class C family)